MRTARNTLASLLLVALFVSPVFAQDIGTPDTCRFEPTATTWEVNSLDDTLFSVELYGYSDDPAVTGISLGFRMETSTGGGTGHDDSLLIVQEWLPNAGAFSPGAFVSPGVSYLDESYGGFGWGYNGFSLGVVTFAGPAFATVGSPAKMGDLTLKLVDPTNMSANFEIEIDSLFFPPAGAFKYSPTGGTGFPPQFFGTNITVVNNLGQATEEPEVFVDPETMHVYWSWSFDPIPASILIPDQDGFLASDIDLNNISINDTIDPFNVEVLPSHPDFSGQVLKADFWVKGFLNAYMFDEGPLFDTTTQSFQVTGETLLDEPFVAYGEFNFVGRYSGDANNDGFVNIDDVIYTIEYVFGGGPAPRPLETVDCNCSGEVDTDDLIYLIEYIFGNGPKPRAGC